MRIVVTGGSGKGGEWVVRELRERGHDVLNVDARHDGSPHGQCLVADLTDLGQTLDALSGSEAVVHFAAIPAPGDPARRRNVPDQRAVDLQRLRRRRDAPPASAWSGPRAKRSSGLPFDTPPAFAPIDETIEPRPESSYSLSKLVGETMAAQFARRTGIGFVGLRISNIMEPDDYARFPSFWDDARLRKWNLWGYVDARDVATAARLGLEARDRGFGDLHRGRGGHGHDPPQRGPDGRGLPDGAAATHGRGPRDAACRSIARGGCSATSRRTAGRTTSPIASAADVAPK